MQALETDALGEYDDTTRREKGSLLFFTFFLVFLCRLPPSSLALLLVFFGGLGITTAIASVPPLGAPFLVVGEGIDCLKED